MSGGSYDYIGFRIKDLREEIRHQDNPRRVAFAKLMGLIGDAMHQIEWVDSGDCSPGDEYAAIDKVFAFLKSDPDTIKKARAYDDMKNRFKSFLELSS